MDTLGVKIIYSGESLVCNKCSSTYNKDIRKGNGVDQTMNSPL